MKNTNYINQYLEFLKLERRVAKNQMKRNIYRIVRYGGDTKEVLCKICICNRKSG